MPDTTPTGPDFVDWAATARLVRPPSPAALAAYVAQAWGDRALVWHVDLNGGGMHTPWIEPSRTAPAANLAPPTACPAWCSALFHLAHRPWRRRRAHKPPLMVIDEAALLVGRDPTKSREAREMVAKLVRIGRSG